MLTISSLTLGGNNFSGKYFVVSTGIDELDLGDFVPVGTTTRPFLGNFNGNGVRFRVAIDKTATDNVGIFGYIQNGTIENFSIYGSIKGRTNVGSAVGYQQSGLVRNIYNEARIAAVGSNIGGIVGQLYNGTVTLTYNRAEITGVSNVGGIIGYTYTYTMASSSVSHVNNVNNNYSSGTVSGDSAVGGVIGASSAARYTSSTGANARNNNYYDITEMANYAQTRAVKPSSLASAEGLSSGVFFSGMSGKLSSGFVFEAISDGFGYYPQLSVFSNHSNGTIKGNSKASVQVEIGDGLGTSDLPFWIRTKEDIEALKLKVASGNTFEGFYFKVEDGVGQFDLGNFTPIGSASRPFYGSFNGNNAEFNIEVNQSGSNIGLFGYFGIGTIENLSIKGQMIGGTYVGAVVGTMVSGIVRNVYNQADISGVSYVGGIVGYLTNGQVINAYNTGDILASGDIAGGIVGRMYEGRIERTYNMGEIIGARYVGGIVGYVQQYQASTSSVSHVNVMIQNYSAGLVSGNAEVGGVIGYNNPGRYTSSTPANVRTHLYYDVSVLVNYRQPRTLKPEVQGHPYGLDGSVLLSKDQMIAKGLTEANWYYDTKEDKYAYYPQLSVFRTHEEARISTESIESVKVDIGYGLGTSAIPFLIKTAEDMHNLSQLVLNGNTYSGFYFKVDDGISELDLGDFVPVGTTTRPFLGNFNGNGVRFRVAIDKTATDNVGIFGYIQNGTIENFSIYGSIKGRTNVGSAVGYQQSGLVRNIYNEARIAAVGSNIGGIVGQLYNGTVTLTYNRAEITGVSNVGGIIGYTYTYTMASSSVSHVNNVNNNYSSGTVSGDSAVGGVIGASSAARYTSSTGANARNNNYYDITEMANYAQTRAVKPSSLASAEGLSSGVFFSGMSGKLSSGFVFEAISDGFGYYPQLSVFSNHSNGTIKGNSKASVQVEIGDGLGTSDLPFWIRTKEDIEALKLKVASGNTFEGFYFKVEDGVGQFDLGNFTPIGSASRPFYGSFNGNNAEFNIEVNQSGSNIGLFGYFGIGTIENLSIKGQMIGGTYVGAVVGTMVSGIVRNVYNQADISGVSYVGGIVGYLTNGQVINAYNTGDILASGDIAGGIVGRMYEGRIERTYNMGEIIGARYVGGIVGYVQQYQASTSSVSHVNVMIQNYSAGLVSGNAEVGGVIGYNNPGRYTSSTPANVRTHLYYDVSVLVNYRQPRTLKPSTVVGGQGLEKTSLIGSGMTSRGFSGTDWTFKDIEGFYAFYPQLRVFSTSSSSVVMEDSKDSVKTIPFIGDGTSSSPYIISSAAEMRALSLSISGSYDAFGVYYLVNKNVTDIDLTENFSPIGSLTTPFRGHFDGNYANFVLNINSQQSYQGLFGVTSSEAVIQRLSVSGQLIGSDHIGSIVGLNKGIVSEVYATSGIRGKNHTGGLIGTNEGTLEIGYFTGDVNATLSNIGGIVGTNRGDISQVYAGTTVIGSTHIGGVAGYNEGTIQSAYYDQTKIEYFENSNLNKPIQAIGNMANLSDVKGLEKIQMQGLSIIGSGTYQLDFDSTYWSESNASGMYTYYLQIKGFQSNSQSAIKMKSSQSARTIRFAIGNGTKVNPYIITSEIDMKILSDITKEDTLTGIYFKVEDGITRLDLTQTGLGFNPIGPNSTRPFRGHFDGNNAIIHLNLATSVNYTALFGYVGNDASITNFTVTGSVKGLSYTAGAIGYIQYGRIEKVYNKATIEGTTFTAGIVGDARYSNLKELYNMGNVKGTDKVAGISGSMTKSTLESAFNFGAITGNHFLGGITGYAETNSAISYVYNRNNVIGSGNHVGGILGNLVNGTLDNAYSASMVRGLNAGYIGGIIGRVGGTTVEINSYYDLSIIEADLQANVIKPIRSIGNKLEQLTVKGVEKNQLTGLSIISSESNSTLLKLDESKWVLTADDGVKVHYPQLKLFSEANSAIKADSLSSVSTYIFAGMGTETTPYILLNERDMVRLSNLVQMGNDFENVYFVVRNNLSEMNLTQTGLNYQPIGTPITPFNGVFDGSGVNFRLSLAGNNYQGLFGVVGASATISQLSVSGSITGTEYVGSIAGYNKGTIRNVYSTATIKGSLYTGGILGYHQGTLESVYQNGLVEGVTYTGGLIGYSEGFVKDGYVSSSVFGVTNTGGILGYTSSLTGLDYLYYNSSAIEVLDVLETLKPVKAISNVDDQTNIKGVLMNLLSSGVFGETGISFSNPTNWVVLKASGFDAYYPQLAYFNKHKLSKVIENSTNSVRVNRFTEGDGSLHNPYIIRTNLDMKAISDLSVARMTLEGKYFRVADDIETIDLTVTGLNYLPIGNENYYFQGNFDGNHTQFILSLNQSIYYQGLFGFVGNKAVIRNLSVYGSVYATRFAGGIAGRNRGLIENVYNKATITAKDYHAGGIVGYNEGIIKNAFNTGDVSVSVYHYAGGITGYTVRNTTVEKVFNTGTIKVAGSYAGGIVGYAQGMVSDTYNAGAVLGSNSGMIIGVADGYATVFNSYYNLTTILQTIQTPKALKAISNKADTEVIKGVYTSEMTGDQLQGIKFNADIFVLKPNDGLFGYYPQLKAFLYNTTEHVLNDSIDAVSVPVFVGEGTLNQPFLIYSSADMVALSNLVLQQVDTTDIHFKVFEANKTLDLSPSTLEFKPIGSLNAPFKGHFDGNHATFNLAIDYTHYAALFGVVESTGSISNLSVKGSVKGTDYVSGVVAFNKGAVENVHNEARIEGLNYVSGIASVNSGTLELVTNKGEIKGQTYTAGITAINQNTIELAYNMTNIQGASYTAGVVSKNETDARMMFVFNYGHLQASNRYLGGVVAVNRGSLIHFYNRGDLTSQENFVGGVVALNHGTVQDGYQASKIMGINDLGGISALNLGSIDSVYYDTSLIEYTKVSSPYTKPSQAIYSGDQSGDIKALTTEEMTSLYAIGTNEDQMNLSIEWSLKLGSDFISYYPELYVFKNAEPKYSSDSLKSITRNVFTGAGTLLDPYLIYDGYDMKTIGDYVKKDIDFTNKYFKVAEGIQTIDLSDAELMYDPIGTDQSYFNGTFDGNKALFTIMFNNPNQDYMGMFHTLGTKALIKNLTIQGTIHGRSYLGGLASRNMGSIEFVTNLVNITSTTGTSTGGIVAVNSGTIRQSVNKGNITLRGSFVGGIAGENEGTIALSYNKGIIDGDTSVGGIAGMNTKIIQTSYNTEKVTGNTQIGGIAGVNYNAISESYNMGSIIAKVGIVGGIAGLNQSTTLQASIINSYNTGAIQSLGNLAGGLVGLMSSGMLSDLYNAGSVFGLSEVGAIIGQRTTGTTVRAYYDLNILENSSSTIGIKPTKAISNIDNTTTLKGLYRGQMAGMNAIGMSVRQMNFSNPALFAMTASHDMWSYYPQIKAFTTNSSVDVRNDSMLSVRGKTFIYGEGTNDNPYILNSESDVIALSETVNSGNDYRGVYFKVSPTVSEFNFVDAEEQYFLFAIGTETAPFNGTLDGSGVNFKLNIEQNKNYQGLFGHVGEYGHLHSFSVSGTVSGLDYTGAIAGMNRGIIETVYNQANVTGRNYTGGLVGQTFELIKNAYNRGKVIGNQYVGGIAGGVDGIIQNTYNTGIIYGKNTVGALAGMFNSGVIEFSYYDTRILNAYSAPKGYIKPSIAVGTAFNSDTVKGLDKSFMTGVNALGTDEFQMNFIEGTNLWSAAYNIEAMQNYPQLTLFSRASSAHTKSLSMASTQTELFEITLDYKGATEQNTVSKVYVIPNEYYQLPVPFKFGFELVGWYYLNNEATRIQYTQANGESIQVYSHNDSITLEAQYKVAIHKVEFIDGNGNVIEEVQISHGDYVTEPLEIPTKNPSYDKVFFFKQWQFDFSTRITTSLKIEATYEEKNRYFKLTYFDGNDQFMADILIEYGTLATPLSTIPEKQFEGQSAYEFEKWDYDFTKEVFENAEVYPIFKTVDRYYQVTFLDVNSNILEQVLVEYGKDAKTAHIPEKEMDDRYIYEFSGWSQDISSVKKAMTVSPIFNALDRYYVVRFLDGNDDVLETQYIKFLEAAQAPAITPQKAYTEMDAYKFLGWDQAFDHIVKDTDIRATFTRVDRYYTITYIDGDGSILDTVTVEYLTEASQPSKEPSKAMTLENIFIFSGWSVDLTQVQSNLIAYAEFTTELRPYTVYFMDGNNEVFEAQEVLYGQNAKVPTGIPRKAAILDIAYKFDGWLGSLTNVRADRYIESTYVEVDRYYIVTFYGYETDIVLKSEQVEYGYAATAPEAPVKPHHLVGYENYFINWNKAFDFVESDLEVHANYGSRIKTYEVKIVNGDETTYQMVEHGKNAILPEPSKTNTDQYTYTFIEWDQSPLNITSDRIITAVFETTTNYFTVTFVNYDGQVLSTQIVIRGENAVEPEHPLRPSTPNKVYIFSTWNKNFNEVESDLTIEALYDEFDRYYEVRFEYEDGTLIQTSTIEYGQSAYAPKDITKASTDQYDYAFMGWDHAFEVVKSNLVIKPIFEENLRHYEVRFYDGDDQLIETQIIAYGSSAILPKVATKTPTSDTYYVFKGFNHTGQNITSNTEIIAEFDAVDRYYQVVFIDRHGTIINEQTIEYGKAAIDPIKSLNYEIVDANTIYTIVGWNQSFNEIKKNEIIEGIYETLPRYYVVNFYSETGVLFQTQTVEYGRSALDPGIPVKADTLTHFYVFDSWSNPFDYVTKNIDINAEFIEKNKSYQVVFLDGNNLVFDVQIVLYGEDAITPNGIPTKSNTTDKTYRFTGWDRAYDNITENLTVYALFESDVRLYTVRFVDEEGRLMKEVLVPYGASATPPSDIPNKPSTDAYDYKITWSRPYTNITQNIEVKLVYEAVIREYTYRFLDAQGLPIKTVKAPYGSQITVPGNPTKPMTEKYEYLFVGWSPDVPELLTKDIDFTPYFEEKLREFEVIFLDGDGKTFNTQWVKYGAKPVVPLGIPTKSETAQYYYQFRTWSNIPNTIYQNVTIESVYNRFLQTYTVTFIDDLGQVLKTQEVEYGTGATEPDNIPLKPEDQMYYYIFSGYNRPFNFVTQDIVVQTVYTSVLRQYTYTFYADDQTTILKQMKDVYGATITPPTAPIKIGNEYMTYVFEGWTPVVPLQLTEDMDFVAVYKEILKTFQVIFLDFNGNVIETQIINYGADAIDPTKIPTRPKDELYEYSFQGWDTDTTQVRSNLIVKPIFSRQLRTFMVTFVDFDGSFLAKVTIEYGKSAAGKVVTPTREGYRFMNWDHDISSIKNDVEVRALYVANDYQINFHGVLTETIEPIVYAYGSTVTLPKITSERRGYEFTGWKTSEDQTYIEFSDGETFTVEEEGLQLYAEWIPIVYNITYELDGGYTTNPSQYTIEDHIELQGAYKEDYQFVGWFLADVKMEKVGRRRAVDLDTPITEIADGSILGHIVLVARYEFDGYIKLKEDSFLSLNYAEITNLIPIVDRKNEESEQPIYLIGAYQGLTIAEIKTHFENTNLEFIDLNNNPVADSSIVYTGLRIVIRDKANPGTYKDEVHVILRGDLNGDGKVNIVDFNQLDGHVTMRNPISNLTLLAALIDDNSTINIVDLNLLAGHVQGKESIFSEHS
ncbi:InlB B-repeat-containing protein [Acholeplasma vituli]|uniref:InlB B-repeat-containing protein n=2 Tax=Paracholeplasma vituli TaxID=69473 RepID=A0ABT2PUX0_9MOLU|nr:InlB B-repeat-containing protein [Paracholeplasma vituli]